MTVYLLWVNDMVTGVYASELAAQAEAVHQRARYGADWHEIGPMRWFQTDGPVARLEIDPRVVVRVVV